MQIDTKSSNTTQQDINSINKIQISYSYIIDFLKIQRKAAQQIQNYKSSLDKTVIVYGSRDLYREQYGIQKKSSYDKSNDQKYQQKGRHKGKPKQYQQQNQDISKKQESQEEIEKKAEIQKNQNLFLEEMKKKNEKEEQKILSKIRFSLNILSPDNVEKIKSDLTEQIKLISSQENMQVFYDLLIKKALEDKKYVNTFCLIFNHLFEFDQKMKKQILLELNKIFDGKKPIHQKKSSFAQMQKEDIETFISTRKRKFMQLGNLLGTFFKNNVIPKLTIHIIMYQLLKNFIEGYDYYLFLKNTGMKENQENDFHYQDYIENLIQILENVGHKLDERHKKKLKSAIYYEKIRDENHKIKQIQSQIRNNDGIEDIDFEDISIGGIFELLRVFKEEDIVSIRIKSLITNISQRRMNEWEERLLVKDNTAKTKIEVYQMQQKEILEKQQQSLSEKDQDESYICESELDDDERED